PPVAAGRRLRPRGRGGVLVAGGDGPGDGRPRSRRRPDRPRPDRAGRPRGPGRGRPPVGPPHGRRHVGGGTAGALVTPGELRRLIDGLAEVPYGGEAVDERAHALQCAWYALRDGADDDLVLAALLHDAGRAMDPELDHERSGEELGRRLLGERVGWLVGSH